MTIRQAAETITIKCRTFASELYRAWVPLATVILLAWWFESLRETHEGAEWLRTLAKVNNTSMGIIWAHVTWSCLFPYVKMGTLLRQKDKESFRAVILARAIYYAAITYAIASGL